MFLFCRSYHHHHPSSLDPLHTDEPTEPSIAQSPSPTPTPEQDHAEPDHAESEHVENEDGQKVEITEADDVASTSDTLTVPQSIGFKRSKTAEQHRILGDDGMV